MTRILLSPVISCLGWLLANTAVHSAPMDVIYPRAADGARWDYHVGLLELALDRSGVAYELRPTPQELTQPREMLNLHSGLVSVIWAGTSRAFETEFRPIRVPLYRGLLGYRVCLIDRAAQPTFSAIETRAALTQLRIGQGVGWSDVQILRDNGFTVLTARYDLLFGMTTANRFDCYLRGVTEVAKEMAQYGPNHPALAVEQELLLIYPFATFFFVEWSNAPLAEALERGLAVATEDGSFQAYFETHPDIRAVFEQLDLNNRRRFMLENPSISSETRQIPAEYWLRGAVSTMPISE